MITLDDYIGPHDHSPDWTPERRDKAELLIDRVNELAEEMQADGVDFRVNPNTGSCVSGQTLGGFRPQSSAEGAPHSAHKEGQAVDLYDPAGELDAWLTAHPEALVQYDLYREAPEATPGWCHLSTRAPKSGKRTFFP